MKRDYYWDVVSEEISHVLRKYIGKEMSILEIGFAGGHFLEWMNQAGYSDLHGIEIRKDKALETKNLFKKKGLQNIELICGDILEHNKTYDAIFSTGLIQCLNETDRKRFIDHVSKMSNLAIYFVPEIVEDRNLNSQIDIAVAGCKEYKTGNIAYELSTYYNVVRVGRIEKSTTNLDDTFIYYICNNSSTNFSTKNVIIKRKILHIIEVIKDFIYKKLGKCKRQIEDGLKKV